MVHLSLYEYTCIIDIGLFLYGNEWDNSESYLKNSSLDNNRQIDRDGSIILSTSGGGQYNGEHGNAVQITSLVIKMKGDLEQLAKDWE